MSDKLKPVNCGCGGEARIAKKILMGNLPDVYIFCENCSIRTREYYSVAEAITAWNRAMGADTNSVVSVFSSEVQDFRTTERTAKVFQSIDGYRCAKCFYRFETTAIPQHCPQCGARLEWK